MRGATAAVFSYQCLWAHLWACQRSGLFDLDWLISNGRGAEEEKQALVFWTDMDIFSCWHVNTNLSWV